MNNYELSRLIVDDIMKKINAGEQVFYMEYVRSVEALLNKHAAQQSVQADGACAHAHLSTDGIYCYDCRSVVAFTPRS